jgi:hypothetical protein
MTTQIADKACIHCGFYHAGVCPYVDEVEYHEDGSVKRVKYRSIPPTAKTQEPLTDGKGVIENKGGGEWITKK